MTLILTNVIQGTILNNIQEVLVLRRSNTLGNTNNGNTVTFKHYNSSNT